MNFVVEKQKERLQQPGLFEVHLHNDDFTPMEFVIEALRTFFHMDEIKAKTIALEAHTKGVAVCGTYSREVAETRIDQAAEHAKTHDHPLKWSMEAA